MKIAGGQIAREGGVLAASQIVTGLARLVGLRLLTELVSPTVYAEFVLILGLMILGINFFCAPVLDAGIRFYADAAAESRLASLRRLLLRLLLPRTAAIAVLLPLAGATWIELSGRSASLSAFVLASLVLVLDVARRFEVGLLNASRRQTEWALWNSVDACLRPAFATVAILALGPAPQNLLLGYAAAIALGNVAFRRRSVREEGEAPAPPGWSEDLRGEILRYATPLIPLALLSWVTQLSDRYFLAGLDSVDAAGIYAATYGLASMPFVIAGGVVRLTLRPVLNDAVSRGDLARERRTVLLWLAVAGGGLGAGLVPVTLFRDLLVRLILGEAFWGGADLVPWIAAAHVVQGVQLAFEAMLAAQRRTRALLVVQVVGAVASIVAYSVLIPLRGAEGAAIGTFLAMACACAASFVLSRFPRRILRGVAA